jgi:hypothetical protein
VNGASLIETLRNARATLSVREAGGRSWLSKGGDIVEKVTTWSMFMRLIQNGCVLSSQELTQHNRKFCCHLLPQSTLDVEVLEVSVEDTDANALLDLKREVLSLNQELHARDRAVRDLRAEVRRLEGAADETSSELAAAQRKAEEAEVALRAVLRHQTP